jgi:hypothetical protein
MSFVELLRVAALQPLHSTREVGPGGVEHEVEVRRHEAEGVDRPVEAVGAAAKVEEELAPVGDVEEDVASLDAARQHVEVPIRERRAENARHVRIKAHDRGSEAPVDKPARFRRNPDCL